MHSTVEPTIVTAHLERMLEFYSGLLGANERRRVPEEGPVFYVGLRIGNSDIGLVSDAAAADAPAGKVLLSIEVADVDTLLPRVQGLGGAISGGPNDMPWGQRVAHIKDPDGNAINLTSPVPSA
jgi:predicted enzyme related to lactoylglutathione lyase